MICLLKIGIFLLENRSITDDGRDMIIKEESREMQYKRKMESVRIPIL